MCLITRRQIVSAFAAFAAIVGFVLTGQAVSATEIKVDENKKICERDAKAKIQEIINKMLDGLEEISEKEISERERSNILNEGWERNRQMILTRYSFKD